MYDVTIIGGGPVGIFAATMAGLHGLDAQVIESAPQLGGQLGVLYPDKPIHDVPGYSSVIAEELVQALVNQMHTFPVVVRLSEAAVAIQSATAGTGFMVITNRSAYNTRCVIIAAGIGSYSPRKLLAGSVPQFEGHGVYYTLQNPKQFSGQTVMVVGGGDTAIEWAISLANYAPTVYLIHRREEFRGFQGALRKLSALPNVVVETSTEIQDIVGHDKVVAVQTLHRPSRRIEMVPVDAVIGALGFQTDTSFLKSWGILLKTSGVAISPTTMVASQNGIYAVGDVARYDNKVKLIATGFGEVTMALAAIRSYLNPQLKGVPHSTQIQGLDSKWTKL